MFGCACLAQASAALNHACLSSWLEVKDRVCCTIHLVSKMAAAGKSQPHRLLLASLLTSLLVIPSLPSKLATMSRIVSEERAGGLKGLKRLLSEAPP